MSLFSDTEKKALTPASVTTAPAGYPGETPAIFRLLSLSALLGLLMVLTMVSIFAVRLRSVPISPGTQSGENCGTPQFVQALESLHDYPGNMCEIAAAKGGDNHVEDD